jgi:hypothetical protein
MTVAELLGRISSDELTEWQAYERAHGPLGPVRGDWQAALIASTIVAVNKGKRGRRPKLQDFLLAWKDGSAADPIETERIGRMLASRLGGTWTEAQVTGGEPDE